MPLKDKDNREVYKFVKDVTFAGAKIPGVTSVVIEPRPPHEVKGVRIVDWLSYALRGVNGARPDRVVIDDAWEGENAND